MKPGDDDSDESWRLSIERYRLDEDNFDPEVWISIVMALLTAARGAERISGTKRILRRFREWYGPRFERVAVLVYMQHVKGQGEPHRTIARALWENHRSDGCADPVECSLHSLGSLWDAWRLAPGNENASWIGGALKELLTGHPLRGWATRLVSRSAESVSEGELEPAEAVELLELAVEAGLHHRLANGDGLADSWAVLAAAAPEQLMPRLRKLGNQIIAAGATRMIPAQLPLLEESDTGRAY
jgi:hypothetical protein